MQTADGKPMEDAGDKYSEDVILHIGTHQEELTWEISRLEDGIDGYLPNKFATAPQSRRPVGH